MLVGIDRPSCHSTIGGKRSHTLLRIDLFLDFRNYRRSIPIRKPTQSSTDHGNHLLTQFKFYCHSVLTLSANDHDWWRDNGWNCLKTLYRHLSPSDPIVSPGNHFLSIAWRR